MQISIRPLTVEEALRLPESILDELALERCMLEDGETDQETLEDNDYVVIKIEFPSRSYIVYHGFPGDNPGGVLITTPLSEDHVQRIYSTLQGRCLPEDVHFLHFEDFNTEPAGLEAYPDLKYFYEKWYTPEEDGDYGHIQIPREE